MKTVARSSVGCVSKVIAAKPVLVAEGKKPIYFLDKASKDSLHSINFCNPHNN